MARLKKMVEQEDQLAEKALIIIKGSISFSNIQIKDEILNALEWSTILNCLKSKNIEIQRITILIILQYVSENVPEFVILKESKDIISELNNNLLSKDSNKITYSLKCFSMIAMSKEWEYKELTLVTVETILKFIFEGIESEDAQEVQEEALNFIQNLII